ncbi:RSB1 Sphingoid long-chain base transporter RSB1 [Candida maltosa Xu316]|uniref:Sphingoid long-chain base transporter RSB1 n=1 Tax=Candida maltosa (strain Xu316) TaxID=1245528 RepID=M3HEA1_CANMX|nr:putative phospholipid-translocating ATPase [Candida maltosa Xu316]
MDATTLLNQYLPTWTPTSIPTSTIISTIDPTNTAGLALTLLEIQQEIQTQTNTISLYFLSKKARGVAASITLINDQNFLATATNTVDFPQITEEMFNATLNLKDLEWSANLYAMNLSVPFNALFTILFGILFLYFLIIGYWSKTKYFTVCMVCGCGLEMAGYLARTLAHYSWSDPNMFLCQIICLTISPAFIMAGIYYLLSQLIIMYGRAYSIIKPIWFSYIFIACDIISLVIQAAGGAAAAISLRLFKDTALGTYIMVAGIAFQVVSMTLFLGLLFDFIYRSFFKSNPKVRFSVAKFCCLLFNTRNSYQLRNELEPYYNPNFSHLRKRPFFNYLPLVILLSVIFIYVRCLYRVVELSEGWRGYLITHEEYIFALDALMVLLGCGIYVFFHPGLIFGKNATKNLSISKSDSTDNNDNDDDEKVHHDYDQKNRHVSVVTDVEYGNPQPPPLQSHPISQKYNNPYLLPTRFSHNKHRSESNCSNFTTTTIASYNSKFEFHSNFSQMSSPPPPTHNQRVFL